MTTPSEGTFGDLLRQLRKDVGLTGAELAERAGLSPRGLNDLERGARTTPRRETAQLLADALGLAGDERVTFLAAARHALPRGDGAQTHPADLTVHLAEPTATGDTVVLATPAPPAGTVSFVFTDIEGSTQLLQQLGPRYADALLAHQRLLRAAFAAHSGYEVDTQGDSFFVAFATAPDALVAAVDAAQALAQHAWPEGTSLRVRMGLHSGAPQLVGTRYIGLDVHRAARIAAAGHGGQILLSEAMAGLVRHDLPGDLTLRDLGAHRLKDLQQAEHIYQAVLADLPSDFPALRSLEAHPHNLSIQTTPLLGREREVAAVCALLRRADVRLVTLTGPGGIGKTRLSLQVAAELLDAFPDGVWQVRLSRLTDPALVIPTIATTLDLKERGGTPLTDVLRGYLRDKQLLLVLDNFEQVAKAAPQIGDLLAASPSVQVLVTSRVTLHLSGEHEYALRPLALPDPQHLPPPERLSQYAAVALFIERAQAAQADFAVTNATAPAVAEICARLDGLPLAIELAAVRVKLLPPPALLKRLEHALPVLTGGARNLDARQQTMRNTLAWSYELLSADERRLFRRLAVFVGGCTLEAAEAVCAAPLGVDVLDGLSRLVDHSLVQQREEGGEARFVMLHIIREFALERLEASGEAEAVRRSHLAFHSGLAELAYQQYIDPQRDQSAATFARLDREHDNVRAALGFVRAQVDASVNRADGVEGVRMAGALGYFWWRRGYLSEGREWLEGLLASAFDEQNQAVDASMPPAALTRALERAGYLALWQNDYVQATRRLESALVLARDAGVSAIAADAQHALALVAFYQGDLERARMVFAEEVEQARAQQEPYLLARAILNLGIVADYLGELNQAAAAFEEALALDRQRHSTDVHLDIGNLGHLALRQGALDRAEVLFNEALVLSKQASDKIMMVYSLEQLATVAEERGHHERAARLLGSAAGVRAIIATTSALYEQADIDRVATRARTALGEDMWLAAYAAGRALSLEEAMAEALGEQAEAHVATEE
jgi:predicted ATPase/class 3 adenylate cyclase/Tfp pilus assembly protein PilF